MQNNLCVNAHRNNDRISTLLVLALSRHATWQRISHKNLWRGVGWRVGVGLERVGGVNKSYKGCEYCDFCFLCMCSVAENEDSMFWGMRLVGVRVRVGLEEGGKPSFYCWSSAWKTLARQTCPFHLQRECFRRWSCTQCSRLHCE